MTVTDLVTMQFVYNSLISNFTIKRVENILFEISFLDPYPFPPNSLPLLRKFSPTIALLTNAIKKCYRTHYLEDVNFNIITDHHSLLWLHNLKDPQGRLGRWVLRLQPYNCELIHRKDKEHIVPGFLSISSPISTEAIYPSHQKTSNKWYQKMREGLENLPE